MLLTSIPIIETLFNIFSLFILIKEKITEKINRKIIKTEPAIIGSIDFFLPLFFSFCPTSFLLLFSLATIFSFFSSFSCFSSCFFSSLFTFSCDFSDCFLVFFSVSTFFSFSLFSSIKSISPIIINFIHFNKFILP